MESFKRKQTDMFELMKLLHFLALVLGAGAGIGNLYLGLAQKRSGETPPIWIGSLRLAFARTGLLGITLIWLTGLYLMFNHYGGWIPGASFLLKILAAGFLLVGVVAINLLLNQAAKTGTPSSLVPKLGMATTALTVLAVIFAVYAFNG